ncbi:hypothetical protein SSPO_072020 [Streptomyces antimycoticus]|uniref:Uncharacterized protein n=1 Tax=Streptomyces antimycoticus TaxID=68175 RepID=A0A499URC9_9ACTN|nr:hypothetical protein SSPO_072020 [Streptomyces antimycoticus]
MGTLVPPREVTVTSTVSVQPAMGAVWAGVVTVSRLSVDGGNVPVAAPTAPKVSSVAVRNPVPRSVTVRGPAGPALLLRPWHG